jgi:murein DD-endopeptidase MepM/ murein hydrolase activator NlpD
VKRLLGIVGSVVLALVMIVVAAAGAVASLLGGSFGAPAGAGCVVSVTVPGGAPAGLTGEQAGNAATIIQTGASMGVPVRGWVIGIATALQESDLVNLGDLGANNDHDSLGLFQQRPSQGWGTPAQIMDPVFASRSFYTHLLAVPGWQSLPLTEAAQAVQKSAFPDAYAKHEPRATAIVAAFTGGALPLCNTVNGAWVSPVPGATLTSGFRTPDRPTHDGIDLAAPRGTVIHAASAGVVATILCNVDGGSAPPDGQPSPCDHDGGLSVTGCGWYVEIRHPGNLVTRYCHMLSAPIVKVGQPVVAGQPIGVVGMSGNASGPHCHFEVHTGFPALSSNATDPQSFLNAHGVKV